MDSRRIYFVSASQSAPMLLKKIKKEGHDFTTKLVDPFTPTAQGFTNY